MLNFKIVESQKLIFSKGPVVAADTTNLEAKFEVNDLFTETLRAYWNVRGSVVDSFKVDLNTSGICTIPSEVLASISDPSMYGDIDHILQVSVVSIGKDDTIRTTSTTCEVPVYKSSYTGNISQPSKPSGDGNVTNIITGAAINGEQMDFYNGNNVIFSTPLANLKNFLLPIAGGNMQGNINMDGNAITGLPNAVNDTDALTLAFAETLFAPSGYGYGDYQYVEIKSGEDFATKINNLVAGWSNSVTKQYILTDSNFHSYSMLATICKLSSDYVIVSGKTFDGYSVSRFCLHGTWQPWKWENPPMVAGVEYQTVERYNGAPVYTKLISCGVPANNKRVETGHGTIFRHSGNLNRNTSLPFALSNSETSSYWAESQNDGGVLSLYCGSGFASSGYTWFEQIWWI